MHVLQRKVMTSSFQVDMDIKHLRSLENDTQKRGH